MNNRNRDNLRNVITSLFWYTNLSISKYKLVRIFKKYIKKKLVRLKQEITFSLALYFYKNKPINNLLFFEKKIYSQNGEDGILQIIFKRIKTKNKFFVEIGVGGGSENNTRLLKEQGWKGLWFDKTTSGNKQIKKAFITKENIEKLFIKNNVPNEFDLLSIDIDGNDYWIWKALDKYKPQVVAIEYNSSIPTNQSKVIKYDPKFIFSGTNYYGASLKALNKLAKSKGYVLLYCESRGINAFFIKKYLVKNKFTIKTYEDIYTRPNFGERVNRKFIGHKKDTRTKNMLNV